MNSTGLTEPATAATVLINFYREPAKFRHRLVHESGGVAGGALILKYAQHKWPAVLYQGRTQLDIDELRRAARFFIQQVCFWDDATLYQLLCLPVDAKPAVIKGHYRLLVGMIHPDRQRAAGERWPANCIARVNHAFEILADENRRAEYDVSLGRRFASTQATEFAVDASGTASSAKWRNMGDRTTPPAFGRPAFIAVALIALVLVSQLWMAGQLPEEYAVLERTVPFATLANWIKGGQTVPRVSATADLPGLHSANSPPDALIRKESLTYRSDNSKSNMERLDSPVPAGSGELNERSSAQGFGRDDSAARSMPSSFSGAPPANDKTDQRNPDTRQVEQLEAIVFLLATSVEAGDLPAFMNLFDSASMSKVKLAAIEQAFGQFFRSTRDRRLSFDRLTWQITGPAIVGRGAVIVEARYLAESASRSRNGPVSMELVRRNGRFAIRDLNLYPYELAKQ
jgi:curved DNA-binding protein CbpA